MSRTGVGATIDIGGEGSLLRRYFTFCELFEATTHTRKVSTTQNARDTAFPKGMSQKLNEVLSIRRKRKIMRQFKFSVVSFWFL